MAAAGAVAIVAAGCASFVSPPTGAQLAPNGPVAISSTICLDSFLPNNPSGTDSYDASQDCGTSATGPAQSGYNILFGGQFLIAYLVPDGSGAPSTFTSSDLTGVTFSRNSIYDAWLNANAASASGYEWVGYMSSQFFMNWSSPKEFTLTPDFTPPAGTNGQPYAGPYVVKQVIIGDRFNSDVVQQQPGYPIGEVYNQSLDPTRALNCDEGETDFGGTLSIGELVASAAGEKPNIEPVGGYSSPTTACDNEESGTVSAATRDLTTVAPASAITAVAGTTATVPFTVQYSGPSADPFMLSASTSSDALIATPANVSYAPSGTGNTVENVTVPIPAGLTPGTYTVTLNVGAFGSTAATLTVTAPATTTTTTTTGTTTTPVNPQQAPAISGLSINNSSLTVSLRLNIAASERLTLRDKHGKHWSTLKTLTVKGSAGNNVLKLKNLFGSLVSKTGQYQVTVQAFANNLKSAPQTLSFTVSSKGSHRRA